MRVLIPASSSLALTKNGMTSIAGQPEYVGASLFSVAVFGPDIDDHTEIDNGDHGDLRISDFVQESCDLFADNMGVRGVHAIIHLYCLLPIHLRIGALHILQFREDVAQVFSMLAFLSSVQHHFTLREFQSGLLCNGGNALHPFWLERGHINRISILAQFLLIGSHLKHLPCAPPEFVDCVLHFGVAFRCAIAEAQHPFTAVAIVVLDFLERLDGN